MSIFEKAKALKNKLFGEPIKKNQQEDLVSKDQLGANSTDSDSNSNEGQQVQQGQQQKKPLEFVNEKLEDWPQWSIEQKPITEEPFVINQDEKNITMGSVLYNRGMDHAIRTKLMSKLKEQVQKYKAEHNGEVNFKDNILAVKLNRWKKIYEQERDSY